MIQKIVATLEELGFVREDKQKADLLKMSVPQLMEDFVLPQCLCLPRSGCRYPRIDERFMELMARHGKDFLDADYELGSVLLECAMQRITKHPDLPAIDYRGILPEAYQMYAASAVNPDGINGCPDEPGLWGSEEVHFLLEMLPVCIGLANTKYADHAQLILFQLLTKLPDGLMWLDERYCDKSAKVVWCAAVEMLNAALLEGQFISYCVKNKNGWRIGLRVFQSWVFPAPMLEYLVDKIDLEKEAYYKGSKRRFLKLFGLYGKMTRKCLMKELTMSK